MDIQYLEKQLLIKTALKLNLHLKEDNFIIIIIQVKPKMLMFYLGLLSEGSN